MRMFFKLILISFPGSFSPNDMVDLPTPIVSLQIPRGGGGGQGLFKKEL